MAYVVTFGKRYDCMGQQSLHTLVEPVFFYPHARMVNLAEVNFHVTEEGEVKYAQTFTNRLGHPPFVARASRTHVVDMLYSGIMNRSILMRVRNQRISQGHQDLDHCKCTYQQSIQINGHTTQLLSLLKTACSKWPPRHQLYLPPIKQHQRKPSAPAKSTQSPTQLPCSCTPPIHTYLPAKFWSSGRRPARRIRSVR